jgi:iron complex outermembrane receptor protein
MDFTFEDFELETAVGDSTQLVQLAGNDVPGVAPHRIFAGITYEHPLGIYSSVSLRWVDQYFANDFNGPPPGSDAPELNFVNDAFTVVDLRLGLQETFGGTGVELFLGLSNLFDERYCSSVVPNAARDRFFEPASGRTWYSGLNLRLPER